MRETTLISNMLASEDRPPPIVVMSSKAQSSGQEDAVSPWAASQSELPQTPEMITSHVGPCQPFSQTQAPELHWPCGPQDGEQPRRLSEAYASRSGAPCLSVTLPGVESVLIASRTALGVRFGLALK